jgi:hypothetical protein
VLKFLVEAGGSLYVRKWLELVDLGFGVVIIEC